MSAIYPTLDPQAKRYITDDWSAWLRTGDTLASATVLGENAKVAIAKDDVPTAAALSLTPVDDAVSFFVVPTGTAGTAKVTIHGVSTQGEEDDHTITWFVQHT